MEWEQAHERVFQNLPDELILPGAPKQMRPPNCCGLRCDIAKPTLFGEPCQVAPFGHIATRQRPLRWRFYNGQF
jgi:hypothetical protein